LTKKLTSRERAKVLLTCSDFWNKVAKVLLLPHVRQVPSTDSGASAYMEIRSE